jgi:TonB dependent receptor/Carboxypeptidase regulatory-like domain
MVPSFVSESPPRTKPDHSPRKGGTRLTVALLLAALAFWSARTVLAQVGTGSLTGTVIDYATKRPAAGVLVTVSSPALQDQQVATTDASGFYRIPNLPPGVYFIRFDKEGYLPNEHGDIALRADTTLRLNAGLASGAQEDVRVTVRPNVDVGSSSSSTTLDSETIKRVPVSAPGGKGSAARSFESVAELAPGANADLYGTSINGSSSPENHYSVDGLSVGNPGKGIVGTQLSSEFVDEINVVTAGYMPEFGRATGGILNVVTKTGSNDFHGSVFSYFSPGALEGTRSVPLTDAAAVVTAPTLSYIGDIGVDLGGPIVKDKLWFYTGFDVSNTRYNIARSIHRTITTGGTSTIETAPVYSQDYVADARTIQGMAKLTWSLNPDNRITLAAYGTPTVSGGGATFDGQNVTGGKYSINPQTGLPEAGVGGNAGSPPGTFGSQAHQFVSTPLDASLKWNSQFLGKRLLLDVMVGTHYQNDGNRAVDGSSATSGNGLASYYRVGYQRTEDAPGGFHSVTDFETFPGMEMCTAANASCAVANYWSGAPLSLNEALYHRYSSSVIVSYLANLWGHHLIKAGFDGELADFENTKVDRVFLESTDGTQFNDNERFGVVTAPDQVSFIDPLRKKTRSMTVGGFIQDSWSVFDKVTVNLGVRYDSQIFYNTAGNVALSLPNQWSPRLGLIYDPTQSGKAKMFVNYARYYENAPLDFADVVLLGEPQIHGGHLARTADQPNGCDPRILAQQARECQSPDVLVPNSDDPPRAPNQIFTAGGSPNTLDPDIQASSSDEVSGGAEYEVLPDARVGLTYSRRWINRWVEDMVTVASQPGFAGNPGFGLGSTLPQASRVYQGVTLFFMKSFSRSWLAQASYQLASLRGNYSGLFASEDGYLGPNGTADFDGPNIENNRYGALPGDFRHTIKLLGSKDWQILPRHHLGTGVSLRARSGGATSLLAADPFTYPDETYLVARGSGPRLPWTFTADLQLAYRVALVGNVALSFTADVFNVLNLQATTSVDQSYTNQPVIATAGTTAANLGMLKDNDGNAIIKKPSYGQATGFQAPRTFRFGLRGAF